MAVQQITNYGELNTPDFTSHDYIIGGKLVVGKAIMDESYSTLLQHDNEARKQLKQKLVHDMAQYMLENNLVEFTQQDDPITFRKAIMVQIGRAHV